MKKNADRQKNINHRKNTQGKNTKHTASSRNPYTTTTTDKILLRRKSGTASSSQKRKSRT